MVFKFFYKQLKKKTEESGIKLNKDHVGIASEKEKEKKKSTKKPNSFTDIKKKVVVMNNHSHDD